MITSWDIFLVLSAFIYSQAYYYQFILTPVRQFVLIMNETGMYATYFM